MKVEIVVGNNLYSVAETVIGLINVSNSLDLENFIVVPDRFSLIAEKLQFTQNNLNSIFNTKVVGISKLASYFSPEIKILSNDLGELKIYEILKNLNLEYFKPNFEVARQVFNILSQLKSSQITPEQFKNNARTKKLFELSLIFDCYEINKTLADSSDILNNLIENMDYSKMSKCNFFFAGFDSLTSQGEIILEKIILNSKRTVIGAVSGFNQKNYFIYDEDILNKINKIKKKHNFDVEKIIVKNNNNELGQHLLNNLFSGNENYLETNKAFLLQFEKPESEIVEIAKTILFKIKNENKSFSDFNILSGNLEENCQLFEEIFSRYNIPLFIDNNIKINSLPIYSFFKYLFNFIFNNEKADLINLLLNPYVNLDYEEISSFQNFVLKYGFDTKAINHFTNIKNIIEKLNKIKNIFKEKQSFFDFLNVINLIIELFNLKEKNDEIIKKIKNDLKLEKIYIQIFKKLEEVNGEKEDLNKISGEEFANIFLSIFGGKEVSSIPISIDCVYLGSEKSFYEKRDVMFISNCKQGAVPKVVKDIGIFCDEDISLTNLSINPTIKMINKRNKQKLLFDISLCKELFVSVSENLLGEKVEVSSLFFELGKILTKGYKPLRIITNFYDSLNRDKFVEFYLQDDLDFENFILLLLSENKISKNEAKKLVSFNNIKKEEISLNIYKKLSPTQIENFFKCPFKHFFFYGLKIKENETNNFDGRDFGNYLHLVAKKFVKNNITKLSSLTEKDINFSFNKIVKEVEQDDRFVLLKSNKNNSHFFSLLRKEAKTMVEKIVYEQTNSNFLARYVEKPFSLPLGEINLSGIIDRVDISENYFRVVDYKSGEVSRSLKKVYFGCELQLFIYLIAMEALLGLIPAGCFYFPISIDYTVKDIKKFCLDGFVINSNQILLDLDRHFNKFNDSDIVSVKVKKDLKSNEILSNTKKNVFSTEGFDAILSYVKKLIFSAKEQIASGKFPANPIGDSFDVSPCKNCPLFCICSFKQNEGEQLRTFGNELSEQDFKRIIDNEGK